jgi:hypothetical protein
MLYDELYKNYKYYGNTENVTTLGLMKSVYDRATYTIKNKIQYFNYCKFEGFYLIRFNSYFLNELKETMIYYGKDYTSLQDKLFILYYHLNFGFPDYHGHDDYKKVIDEYCSVYDAFQKIKFIQRLPELTMRHDMFCENLITDIKLSESEYKLLEKFLLKQLKHKNIRKIEHYPKRGFLRRI